MSDLGDRLLAFRARYSLYASIVLAVYVLWILYPYMTGPSLVSRSEASAVVVKVSEPIRQSEAYSTVFIELKMHDKKTIKTSMSKRPYPKVDDIMPIIIWEYEDGKKSYSIFYEKWAIGDSMQYN